MSVVYRFMRLIVFFDLPSSTSAELREYNRFRKFLVKSGFVMMQESVYSKIVLNNSAGEAVKESVRRERARSGSIQMLTVTERQFAAMEYVTGKRKTDVVDSDERLVII